MVEPTVPVLYLLARPVIEANELDAFFRDRGLKWVPSVNASDAEHIVEIGGRICYMSFTEDTARIRHPNAAYIANLVKKGHESVLEHATWTFILDRVSRAFTHQLVRHRVGFAYSQLSQQYHDEADATFVKPAGLSAEAFAIWEKATVAAREAYRAIMSEATEGDVPVGPEEAERRRFLRSAARSVLPNATETSIVVTANARALRHFLDLRGATLGDVEMRLVSAKIFEMLSREAPALVADFETETASDGWPIVVRRN